MYPRLLERELKKKMFGGRALIITGARQTGKTTLVNTFLEKEDFRSHCRIFNCDNPTDRESLREKDLNFLVSLIGKARIIFIDEGQKVSTIGETVKLLVDHFGKKKQVIVSGSSSVNLLSQTQEPLTGRKWVFHLYALSLEEMYPDGDLLNLSRELEQRILFGTYPEIVTSPGREEKIELLDELASSYLYKDIFEFQSIKNPDLLFQLLKALALQIGSQVSYLELSRLLGVDKNTVERYVDLLEKNFVLFRLPPFFQNKRKEISKMRKIFFYDTGIRNAIIGDFRGLDSRTDTGMLWENFVMVERMKFRAYHRIRAKAFFWRTFQNAEIDLVEEREGKLHGYEFKWSEKKKIVKAPTAWAKFPEADFQCITPKDWDGFAI